MLWKKGSRAIRLYNKRKLNPIFINRAGDIGELMFGLKFLDMCKGGCEECSRKKAQPIELKYNNNRGAVI